MKIKTTISMEITRHDGTQIYASEQDIYTTGDNPAFRRSAMGSALDKAVEAFIETHDVTH